MTPEQISHLEMLMNRVVRGRQLRSLFEQEIINTQQKLKTNSSALIEAEIKLKRFQDTMLIEKTNEGIIRFG